MLANRKRLPLLALGLAVGAAPGSALANDWPQLGLDAGRGRASSEVSGVPFEPLWQSPVGAGSILSSPVVADGYVVAAGAGGELRVLRALDGATAWTTTVTGGIAASPAIDRGRVFVPSLKGKLQAFSLASGQSLWQRAFGGFNYGSPSLVDGTLVIATGFPGQSVARLDAATGATLWESAADAITNIVGSSAAIAGSRVLLGVNGGRYQALDLNTGATGWHLDTVGAVGLSAPLVIGGNAYLLPGGTQAALYAADATSGTALAGWPVTATDPAAPGGATSANRVAVSSPVSLGALIAFQARFEYDVKPDLDGAPGQHVLNEYLVAVDPMSASVAWVRPTGQRTVASINEVPGLNLSPTPVVFATAGMPAAVVASSVSPTVSAFDATGNPLWSAPLSAPTRSSPTLANGLLLVATEAGQVQAFRSTVNAAPLAPAGGFNPAEGQMVDTPAPTLSWSAGQDDRDNPLHYEVRVGSAGSDLLTSWIAALSVDGSTQVSLERGRLPVGQSYVYAVRARDPQGAWSAWSSSQSFFLPATPSVQVGDATYDTLDQALAAAPAGSTITLGEGLLHLHAPVQLPAGISLAGAGPQHTVLDGTGLAVGVSISAAGRTGAGGLRGLTVANAQVGVQVVDTHDTVLRNVVLYGNTRAGLEVMEGASAQVINATFVHGGAGVLAHGALAVRNSIVTDNQIGFVADGAGTVASRYNDLFANHGTNYQGAQPGTGDLVAEIAFASSTHQDFHLRFTQATTDRGDPADDFTTEPAPNGGRVNMGAYGGTIEAEQSALTGSPGASSPTPDGGSAGGCAVAGEASPSRWVFVFLAALALAARRRRAAAAVRTRRPGAGARRVLGVGIIGLLVAAAAPAEAAVAIVQERGAANAGTSSLSVSWGSATTTGNLLVAAIAVRGGSGTTITPPSGDGWTLAKRSDNANGTVSTAIYYVANASSQSTTARSWNLSASVNATISVLEYSGVDPTSPLDLTVASSGTGTTATTSASSTVAQAAELAVGAVSAVGAPTLSGLTSTYTQQDSTRTSTGGAASTQNTTETYDLQFTGALPAIGTSLTISASSDWAGVIVTFKSRAMHWIAGSAGIFSANGNWSWSKGGTSNGTNPGNNDDVIFDNGGLGNVTTTSAVTVNSLELQSTYTGTVTAGAGGNDRVKTNWDITVSGGILSAGGGAFRTNNSGSYLGNFVITGGELDGAGAAIQGVDLIMSGGTLITGSGTITVRGDTIFSGGTISLGGNANFENISGTYTQTGGTLSVNANTATFNEAVEIDGGTLLGAAGGTITMKSTLGMNGSTALVNVNGGTMTLTSDLTLTAGTLEAASAGTMTLNNAVTVNGSNALLDAASGTITVTTAGSNVTLSAGSVKASSGGTITISRTVTVSGGTMDANTGRITIGSATTAIGGAIKATSGTVTFSASVTASGATFDAAGGTIDASTAGVTFALSAGSVSGTNGTVKFAVLTVSGTGTYDGAGGTTTASGLVSVTAAGATYKTGSGSSTLSLGLTVSNGTFDATGGTTTVSGATLTVSGGTYKVGTGTTTASNGLTLSSGTVNLLADGGQLKLGSAQTLAISGGTLQATGTTQATYPKIASSSGNYTFTVSAGTLNLNGLQVQNTAATGMNVSGTAVTFTSFKNVRFTNNAGSTGSRHLAIARGALGATFTLNAPGCAFDTTALTNVATTSTGSTFFAYFDEQNGLGGEGDSRDSDGDASPDNGTVDNSATNSSLVLWTWAQETDTTGVADGFPSAAFDWNTFTFYSVYASFSGVATNTDRIYVRSVNGGAGYSFDFSATNTTGTIVGTPRWDTVNETGSFDVNGNGILGESNIHVLYVAMSKGYIYKLIDNGTSLAKPASGTWATQFPTNAPGGSVTISTITTPVVSDGSNLYFGGTDGSSANQVFKVQISSGGTTCNGNSNGRTTQEECAGSYSSVVAPTALSTAFSWATASSSSYIYFADTSKVYRLNATAGTLQSSFSTSSSVNGSVRTIITSVWCTDTTGHLYNLFADPTANSGTMSNKSGFPYVASGNPSLSPPYADTGTGFEYFGDANGKVYKVNTSGTASTGYPFTTGLGAISQAPLFVFANNYLIAGDSAGKVAYIDTTGPTLKYTLTLSGSISAISYNAAANSSAGEVMVSTSTGGLYYLPKALP